MILKFFLAWIATTVILVGSVWTGRYIIGEIIPLITHLTHLQYLLALVLWAIFVTAIAVVWTYFEERNK